MTVGVPGKQRRSREGFLPLDREDSQDGGPYPGAMDLFYFERDAREKGYRLIAGVDEAGRGPLAGPVVAAAVILPWGHPFDGLTDSKLLTRRQREDWFARICASAIEWAVAAVDEADIDRINILQATLRAMKTAVAQLSNAPDYILIDGITPINVDIAQRCITKGDQRSRSIAAASVIAKVTRDRIMDTYHQQYPHYNFARNKGYGSREHIEALRTFGYCPIHRKSFRRVKDVDPDNKAASSQRFSGHPKP